jgi:anti-sigma-K factor RskA
MDFLRKHWFIITTFVGLVASYSTLQATVFNHEKRIVALEQMYQYSKDNNEILKRIEQRMK